MCHVVAGISAFTTRSRAAWEATPARSSVPHSTKRRRQHHHRQRPPPTLTSSCPGARRLDHNLEHLSASRRHPGTDGDGLRQRVGAARAALDGQSHPQRCVSHRVSSERK